MNVDPSLLLGLRPRMMSVAYRMLGSVLDAEDAVQDAFVRLQTAGAVDSPEGFLIRTTTRLCIDRLRADRRRQEYIGPWLPEPVDTRSGAPNAALSESLKQAFLLMLERLTPDERAAFLLRSVFDYEYAEIADVLDKSEVHARQIVSRAREHLRHDEPRFHPAPHEADGLAERFISACRAGDVRLIEQMLTEDAEVHTDGGGKTTAARVVIQGRSRSARFLAGVFRKPLWRCPLHPTTVNGAPGLVSTVDGVVMRVLSLRIEDGVRAVYITLNPDKLTRWSDASVE